MEATLPGHSSRSHPSATSSKSPSRIPNSLPTPSYSPGQPSGSSASSTHTFSATSPSSQPLSIPPHVPSTNNPASALSPIATRTRQRDADAMEKYKLRQRSGSATTASTDTHSQNGSNISSGPDHVTSLNSLVTVGSVAPRRRLRPSASAAQLRSTPPALINSQHPTSVQQDASRNRSGTSPGTLRHIVPPMASSPPSDTAALSTPTQNSTSTRSVPIPNGISREPSREKAYTGPPSEYAIFPPPPFSEEPERVPPTPAATNNSTTYSRRLPFNILSSHKNSIDQQVPPSTHKRNASVNIVTR